MCTLYAEVHCSLDITVVCQVANMVGVSIKCSQVEYH